MSAPAAIARTAASPGDAMRAIAAIDIESVKTSPSNPIVLAQQTAIRWARSSSPGLPEGSSAGQRHVRDHDGLRARR